MTVRDRDPLPLAAEAQRLRGTPGRPRKQRTAIAAQERLVATGRPFDRFLEGTVPALCPRLLDLRATAAYLGVSAWTVRDLLAAGELRRVRIPLGPSKELRRVLIDREDIDRLLEAWKDSR